MFKEYKTIKEVVGPLLLVEGVEGVKYNELVEIVQKDGEVRHGKVLEVHRDKALVQLFESSQGLQISTSRAKFLGRSLELSVSEDMLGRVFDGMGRPRDGSAPVIADKRMDVNGEPLNPAARDYPNEFIQTGVSAIDGLNTLVRGQKLPVFQHERSAARRICGADRAAGARAERRRKIRRRVRRHRHHVRRGGIFRAGFQKDGRDRSHGALYQSCQRSRHRAYRHAAHGAHRVRSTSLSSGVCTSSSFMHGHHQLLRRRCARCRRRAGKCRGRRGYPGYLYTDLASLYERAGRIRGKQGSITQIPILTMPEDDKTHPIPDLTGYITEGQIILSRELYKKGVNPPVDVLPSLSRLKDKGIGAGKTREDHADTMNQLFSAYARGKEAKELSAILGEAVLSKIDKLYADFAEKFEKEYVSQGFSANRSIEETLDLGWKLLSGLPKSELKRIKEQYIEKYYRE